MNRVCLFFVQVRCFLGHGLTHPWAREIELGLHIARYRDSIVKVCGRCGASRLYGK